MTAAAPSSKRIEANRRNAQKSTGPRTPAGKDRVRLNALKHGLTASTAVLPGEDAEALQSRVEAWRDDLEPRSAMEAYLVERAAHVSWQLDRADRTIAARLTDQMRHHCTDRATREADEVADLAARLFWDPRGAIGLYPHYDTMGPPPRISTPASPDDPLNPARIVNRLEATALGCRWLLDRWGDLRKILEDGKKWTAPDRLRAVRLLGAQPMDAIANDDVMSIYLACQAMDPQAKHAFADLCSELEVGVERVQYMEHVAARGYSLQPETPEGGQLALLELVARAVTRIEALLRVHDERQSPDRPGRLDRLAFDDSDEGERLRRYQLAHGRILLRTVSTIFKVRKELEDLRDLTADVEAGPPSLYEPSVVLCADIDPVPPGSPSDRDLLMVEVPEIPTEAGSPEPAAVESAVAAESGLSQTGETNPVLAEDGPTPPLDPCSEGRHVEPPIHSEPPIASMIRAGVRAGAKSRRHTASHGFPPSLVRILTELVMRQAVTGGPSPLPGQGRFARAESP